MVTERTKRMLRCVDDLYLRTNPKVGDQVPSEVRELRAFILETRMACPECGCTVQWGGCNSPEQLGDAVCERNISEASLTHIPHDERLLCSWVGKCYRCLDRSVVIVSPTMEPPESAWRRDASKRQNAELFEQMKRLGRVKP